jgi:cytochrome b6-f complex iron-sulfur subunit
VSAVKENSLPLSGMVLSPRDAAIARLKDQGVWNRPIDRRKFFSTTAVGWTLFSLCCAGLASIFGGSLIPRVDFGKPQTFNIGPRDKYFANSVNADFLLSHRIWVVCNNEKLVVLSAICTHLGCTPIWEENGNKFKCPCHGSGFYGPKAGENVGVNFEGPAPRALERFKVTLGDDGQIIVDKSQRFLKENGDWDNPESFIEIS